MVICYNCNEKSTATHYLVLNQDFINKTFDQSIHLLLIMTFVETQYEIKKFSVYEYIVIWKFLNSQILKHIVVIILVSILYVMPVHFICHNHTIDISTIHVDKK